MELPSLCIGLRVDSLSPNTLEKMMRSNDPPIIARIEDDMFVMDPRTIQEDEYPIIETAIENRIMKA